jgi:uncharacterized protein YodC (DUF2158 family)
MSKWIRNRKRTDGYPKGLEGKKLAVRQRDGEIFIGIVGEHKWLRHEHFNTGDGTASDVMSYRIIEDKPAVPEKDPAKIAPKLWVAYKDVLNDEALAALRDVICEQWGLSINSNDAASIIDAFKWADTFKGYSFWNDVCNGEYNKQKSAIELQDAEIGIPEPVNVCFGGVYVPDEEEEKHYAKSKYHKPCKGIVIDVYDVIVAFNVTCPAMAHAIKKMLMAGQRGAKDSIQDKEEAIASIKRSVEDAFVVCDVVIFNSGGPLMTVESDYEGLVSVRWFNESRSDYCHDQFLHDTLSLIY